MTFDELPLSSALKRAIADLGHTTPTPIQEQAIPLAVAGKDLIASAQTGTGKTAAFTLPALTRLEDQKPTPRSSPRVLVLTPTRELASQIHAAARDYGKHSRFSLGTVVGGMPFGPQLRMLSQRVDLLVATPGRLIDHLDRRSVLLDRVELLILDEADRMLDMGFIHAVKRIASLTPADRQTLLFTATWDERMGKLSSELMRDPERVAVAPEENRHERIAQRMYLANDSAHKERLLRELLESPTAGQIVVFGSTKRRVDRLAEKLERTGLAVGALHGDMNQNARNRTIEGMKAKRIKILVATDVAGRGIDIDGVGMVVNFDLPKTPEDYVHRIGRTGRAGASGVAYSIAGPEDLPLLMQIERTLKTTIERAVVPGFEPTAATVAAAAAPANGHRNAKAGRGRGRRPGGGQGHPGRSEGGRSEGGRSEGHGHGHSRDGQAGKPRRAGGGGGNGGQGPRPEHRAAEGGRGGDGGYLKRR